MTSSFLNGTGWGSAGQLQLPGCGRWGASAPHRPLTVLVFTFLSPLQHLVPQQHQRYQILCPEGPTALRTQGMGIGVIHRRAIGEDCSAVPGDCPR